MGFGEGRRRVSCGRFLKEVFWWGGSGEVSGMWSIGVFSRLCIGGGKGSVGGKKEGK